MIEVKRSVELEEQARESDRAFKADDQQWFEARTADGGEILAYGSAPGEEFRGRDAALSLTLTKVGAMHEAVGVSLDESPEVECFEAGDTGWIVEHGHFELADGSRVPTRSVTVLVRDVDIWRRVFSAVHVLVPNEQLTPGSPLASQP